MIEVNELTKAYGDVNALDSVNLSIRRGEFIAILGPSGCGKTTLLKLLAGFMKPSGGSVEMDSRVVALKSHIIPPEKRNIGMVFQSFALWPHMTVAEHIRFPLDHHFHTPPQLKRSKEKRVEEVLKLVGLEAFRSRYPEELSGGQKQRVAFARAIAHKPDVLLMDEPLSALDAELRTEMRKEIQRIHYGTGATIIYVTHDQGEALAMADRIIVMKDGKIEQAAKPEVIYTRPETEFVATFVGKSNLIKGVWEDNGVFYPNLADGISWPDRGVSVKLKRKGLYPVRPEQWTMTEAGNGLPGVIQFVQYQGKEIHYTVRCGSSFWTVHQTTFDRRFSIGDQVKLTIT